MLYNTCVWKNADVTEYIHKINRPVNNNNNNKIKHILYVYTKHSQR